MPEVDTEIILDGKTVIMSLDYWLLVTEYKIDVNAVRQKYEIIK